MTGFATRNSTITRSDGSKSALTVNIKSLNARYFEATCKLPYPLQMLEIELTKQLKTMLHRGSIYFTLYLSNPNLLKGTIEPAFNLIEQYNQAVDQIQQRFSIAGELSIATLLNLPHVFVEQEQTIEPEVKQHIMKQINLLITDLIATQEQEGASLKADMIKRFAYIGQEINAIEAASLVLIETQKEKVQHAMKELEFDESQFAQVQKSALYTVLDKIDIHEEIIRFKSHLESVTNQLKSNGIEKGKRLDFTLQELGREINTITAKCSDAPISRRAINIKVELEKVREQVQNII